MASKSSAAAALFLATLLLFAVASALAQTPPPEEEEEEPGCPPADQLDAVIVRAVQGQPLMVPEPLQEMLDELSTREVGECICDRLVPATGITGATDQILTTLATQVLRSLGRSSSLDFECNNQ
jgi:hypothetical protein